MPAKHKLKADSNSSLESILITPMLPHISRGLITIGSPISSARILSSSKLEMYQNEAQGDQHSLTLAS